MSFEEFKKACEGETKPELAAHAEKELGILLKDSMSRHEMLAKIWESMGNQAPDGDNPNPAPAPGAAQDQTQDAPKFRIKCYAPNGHGRWRAGKYWKQGETRLLQSEVSEKMLEALANDPAFVVAEI